MSHRLSVIPAFLLATLIISSIVTDGAAQNRVEFWADAAGTSCELSFVPPAVVDVHVIARGSGNLAGVAFQAIKPSCMQSAVWIADVWVFPTGGWVGNSQAPEGVSLVTVCTALPAHLGSIRYFVTETADPCCWYTPMPTPREGLAFAKWTGCPPGPGERTYQEPALAKGVMIHATAACSCNPPLPVRESSWGGVKALYR